MTRTTVPSTACRRAPTMTWTILPRRISRSWRARLSIIPNLLEWSRLETAQFDGGERMLHNTNHLIGHYDGCDGLKTGFTVQAGFNLTATAMRGDMRLVSVVLGAPSNPTAFRPDRADSELGFRQFYQGSCATAR